MLLLVGGLAPAARAEEAIAITAIVNDEVITNLDVSERLALVITTTGITNSPEVEKRLTPQIIQTLINEALQLQEAKRLSITVSDKEIDAAIAAIEQERKRPPGSLQAFLEKQNVKLRALQYQLRAQIAWGKVVTRKLRRNVTISEDEILRTQQADATVGEEQVRIAAISLTIASPKQESEVSALAKELQQQLAGGADFNALAAELSARPDVRLNPSVWIPERALEPSLAQALRGLKPGEITTPLRSLNSYQIIQLLDRETVKPVSGETEVALKEILLPLKEKVTVKEVDAAMEIAGEIRRNPGNCDQPAVAGIDGVDTAALNVRFVRTQLDKMSPELRILVERLGVGEVTEPFATKEGVRLLMLCEKIDLPMPVPERDKIRNQLFSEKLELEANKLLRNLRREAFIDIKDQP
jgi:peptidyl-prolyl cis-trans isomerase SurA